MKDYYQILGISKGSSKEEIKKAFRKLAHEHHPDKNGGNDAKFKEINEAYSVLSDDGKRSQYDQFGTASGGAGGGFNWQDFQNQGFEWGNGNVKFDFGGFNVDDILGSFFGGGFARAAKGAHITIDIEISFVESIFGTTRDIVVRRKGDKSEEKIKVNIPAGIESGEMIRYKNKGEPRNGGIPGDLYVRIHVMRDSRFHREGYHLVKEIQIKISDALLGSKIDIETADNKIVSIKIPKGSNNGDLLRLRNEGIPMPGGKRGDMLIKIKLNIPEKVSRKAEKLIE